MLTGRKLHLDLCDRWYHESLSESARPRPPQPRRRANYRVRQFPGMILAPGSRGSFSIRLGLRQLQMKSVGQARGCEVLCSLDGCESPGDASPPGEKEPMTAMSDLLRGHPEVALFVALSLGFFVGKRKVGSFSLGTPAGVLLSGVLIGQLHISIPELLKAVSFALFIFVVGYRVGPQFFRAQRRRSAARRSGSYPGCRRVPDGVRGFISSRLRQRDGRGPACRLPDSVRDTRQRQRRDRPPRKSPEEKQLLSDNVSVAYAVTYLFGTAGVAWFLSRIGPRLLGIDLAAACAAQGQDSAQEQTPDATATGEILIRAFRALGPPWAWATVGEVEAAHSGRVLIERIRRDGKVIDAVPDTLIHAGDTLALAGNHDELFPLLSTIGEEVDDPELIAFPLESLPVILTCRATDGKTLAESLRTQGRGVSVTRVTRSGRDMPLTPDPQVHCGDTLHLVGPKNSSNGQAPQPPDRSGAAQ